MSAKTLIAAVGRASGKTTRLIQLARSFDATILTTDAGRASFVRESARGLGANVRVMPFAQYVSSDGIDKTDHVVIDDADDILESLIGHGVSAITLNGAML